MIVEEKNNNFFKFDFFLPDYNLIIEYDGEQHFISRNSGYYTVGKTEEIQKKR